MTVSELFERATELGLRIEPRGDRLAVIPASRCPLDFANVLRGHKRELLDWLETRSINLTPDCIPWLHVARQVLAGEFDECDVSTCESLVIGLRSIPHPTGRSAIEHLRNQKPKLVKRVLKDRPGSP